MDTRVKPAYDEFGQFRGFPLFFVLSKTLGYLLLPTNFLIAIGFVGAILMVTRFASLGRKLVIAAVLLLVICGLSPLGKALLYPLEQRFPSWDAARGAPDGVIVLGASIEADLSVAHGTPVVRGAPDRIIAAAALARRYPNARVVFSGGSANLISNDAREADFAGAVFESLGVDKSRLIMERASRNTQENAEFSKALVKPKDGERWVLVTSAFHMPRSVGWCRKAGLSVKVGRPSRQSTGCRAHVQSGLAATRDGRARLSIVADTR